jgi:hypothetical protein
MRGRDAPRSAALLAVALAATTSIAVYAAARIFERLVLPEPNPAALVWSERSAIFWRMVIAIYAAGAAAFGGVALGRRSPARAARLLVVALAIALVLGSVQAMVWP